MILINRYHNSSLCTSSAENPENWARGQVSSFAARLIISFPASSVKLRTPASLGKANGPPLASGTKPDSSGLTPIEVFTAQCL